MLTYLYDTVTGEYQGNTLTPDIYEGIGKTTVEPMHYDDLNEKLIWDGTQWSVHPLWEN